jgi:hypothetical protein
VSSLRLAQDDCEITAAKGESLLDASNDRNFGPAGGNAESFAKNPHRSGAIVDLKDTAAQSSKRIGDPSRDRDFFAREPARILVDPGDALARRTSRQQKTGKTQQQHKQGSVSHSRHVTLQNFRVSKTAEVGSCKF